MPEITIQEAEQIAALTHDTGYQLLISYIQANFDDLTNSLALAAPDVESQLLGRWRAYREILTILKLTPENFALDAAEMKQLLAVTQGPMIKDIFKPARPPMSPQELQELQLRYQKFLTDNAASLDKKPE